jgi:hypothetical protein
VATAAIITSRRALALFLMGLVATLALLSSTPNAIAAGGCPGSLTTPFLPWADSNHYWLAPGGSFEDSHSSWALTGGAAVGSGSETFFVGNTGDKHSLSIPAGGSATTPPICVTVVSPLMRFFAKGGNSASPLKVEVLATTPLGTAQLKVASIPASATWAPTSQVYFLSNILALVGPGGTTSVKFRFSNPGTAAWQIDDVYVDPWKFR